MNKPATARELITLIRVVQGRQAILGDYGFISEDALNEVSTELNELMGMCLKYLEEKENGTG